MRSANSPQIGKTGFWLVYNTNCRSLQWLMYMGMLRCGNPPVLMHCTNWKTVVRIRTAAMSAAYATMNFVAEMER